MPSGAANILLQPAELVNVFAVQDAFTSGNTGRNTVFAPGLTSGDTSIQKDFHVSETSRIEARLELFNLLNNVNFDVPNRTAFTSNFGRSFAAGSQRQTQLALTYLTGCSMLRCIRSSV